MPKTIDNDLAVTDTCPGFGSAAKYTAVSVREAALDVAAMAETSTKVFVYEAMGRHAGWLAAAAGLAAQSPDDAPQIILFPERAYDEAAFLAQVRKVVDKVGWCVVVASEGIQTADGRFVADAGGGTDAFGHSQLGGVASYLAGKVKAELGYKVHWTLPDYLQRSARHIASRTDWEQAQAVGKAAVQFALKGMNAVMPAIVRSSDAPYRWKIEAAPLAKVANHEKKMPGRLPAQGRFRHHREGAPLPAAADPRRSAAALRQRRPTEVRGAEERGGEEEAAGLGGLTTRASAPVPRPAHAGARYAAGRAPTPEARRRRRGRPHSLTTRRHDGTRAIVPAPR